MTEKRTEQRRHLSLYLRIIDRDTGKAAGHLVDICAKGVRILSNEAFDPGREYNFALDLNAVMNFEQQVVFSAECIWREQEFSSGAWNSGFTVTKMSSKGRQIISLLIDQFAE